MSVRMIPKDIDDSVNEIGFNRFELLLSPSWYIVA